MASDLLRVGVIGLGFGQYHIRGYQACTGVTVETICSRTTETAQRVAKDYGIAETQTDYRAVLDRKDIDAVSICTPVNLHKQMVIEALESGKHVLCEKPLGLNTAEAGEMLESARRSGMVHMTNFGWRFNGPAFRMKSLLDEGYIGKTYHLNARYMMGYRASPRKEHSWRERRMAAGLGAMGDLGVHLIDMTRWWIGEFERVCSLMHTLIPERPAPDSSTMRESELEDACAFISQMQDGVQAVFHVSRCALSTDYIHIDIHGSNGALQFQFLRDTMQASLKGGQGLRGNIQPLSVPARKGALSPQRHFIDAIRSGGEANPSFHEGFCVQQVADAITASEEKQAWVSLK